jgi:hypothetical protein
MTKKTIRLAALALAGAAMLPAGASAGVATYNSTGLLHVSDDTGPAGVTSKITVPPGRTPVQSVEVTNFTVFWPASAQELSARIEGTDGTPVKLFDEGCFKYDDGDVWGFSDAAAQLTWNDKDDPKCDLGGGTFRPVDKLSAFAGKQASGTWTLRAVDSGVTFTNQGNIQTWALRVVHAPPTLKTSAPKKGKVGKKLELTAESNADGTVATGGGAKSGTTKLTAGTPTRVFYKPTKKVLKKVEKKGKARVTVSLDFTDQTGGTAKSSVRVTLKD